MKRRENTGRKPVRTKLLLLRLIGRHASVAITAFWQFPAFFSSCSPLSVDLPAQQRTQIYIQNRNKTSPEAVDLFFFDTSGVQMLDAWQRVALQDGVPVYGLSRAGGKRLAVLSASLKDTTRWLDIRSYADLCKRTVTLQTEQPSAPFLAGETLLEDGRTRVANVALRPLLTRIVLRSVAADFSGRPYAGVPFRCRTLYLSYAGAECHPLGADAGKPLSWISAGWADSAAVKRLPHPEILLQEGCGDIGPGRVSLGRAFYCYAGPQTRLVLGGTMGEDEVYYPIPLAQLEPGGEYLVDVTLRRMSSPDPDIPTETGAVQLDFVTLPWVRGDSYSVRF